MSYEQNFSNNINLAELGLRYDFSFAQTGLSVRESNKKLTFVQYARGSLINDRKTKYLGTDNRTNVGRGGISIVPFIDLNSNGKKDPGEPKAYGLNLKVNGGRIEKSDRDTTIRILSLEPYTNCFIELDPNSFGNVAWRLSKQTYNIAVDPNILKLVEVPVIVAGEATGYVYLEKDGEKKGQGRVIIGIFNSSLKPAGKTLSEDDGFFSYFGLAPGKYFAKVDTAQLRKLGMITERDSLQFIIKGGIEGDIVGGLDFTLRLKPIKSSDTAAIVALKPVIRKDTTYTIIHEVTEELLTISEDCYAIQVGAFKRRSNAEGMRRKLQGMLRTKDVNIVLEGDYFRVRIFNFRTRGEVDEQISGLKKYGFNEFWVVKLLAKQQQRILVFKEDTVVVIKETVINEPVPIINNPAEEKLIIVQPDTVKKAVEVKPEVHAVTEKPVAPEPTIALRVAVFHNHLKALRAQRKIINKLGLPVEIVQQYEYYNVIVTGFFTREETYRYYPELAGIGYPSIVLIENYKKQQ
jgi:cell division septation protein DedD